MKCKDCSHAEMCKWIDELEGRGCDFGEPCETSTDEPMTIIYPTIVCDDAISREAVLKKQYRIDDSATLSTRDVVNVEDIEDLPPVTPSRRKGHWEDIPFSKYFKCSECGCYQISDTEYCPKCGAEMEV